MTVANNYAPVIAVADGSTTNFGGSWNALAAANLVVQLLNTTTGVYTTVTQGSGSTQYQVVTLTPSGFTIAFNTAPAIGNNVVIYRETPLVQTVPYTTSRGFQGSVEEGSFDALTAMMQENASGFGRSLHYAVGTATTDPTLAEPVDQCVLIYEGVTGKVGVGPTVVDVSAAGANAAAAAASAAAAANYAAALSGTSTTSVAIATGAETFTTQTGKQFIAGQVLIIASAANSANYMHGQVTSYNSTTGALVMNITDIGGSGTHADWNISISGTQGTASTNAFVSVNLRVFSSSGTYTPSAGMVECEIVAIGGGGGGGGVSNAAVNIVAAGGGAGGYAKGIFSAATIGTSKTVTIGAGGAGGASGGGDGGSGGTTSVGALISATGGTGGGGNTSNASSVYGGGGGVGSGGTISTKGAPGMASGETPGNSATYKSGIGGNTILGGGASAILAKDGAATGNNATANSGSGGSGATSGGSSTAEAGGSGGSGYVIITEYIG